MSKTRWLASPLAGTIGVLFVLGCFAIFLHKLTSIPVKQNTKKVITKESLGQEIPSVIRIKLLSPVEKIIITSQDGKTLLTQKSLPAGETEYDVKIPIHHEKAVLLTQVVFRDSSAQSAAFFTLLPDNHEEKTCYMIGAGETKETLQYEWNAAH